MGWAELQNQGAALDRSMGWTGGDTQAAALGRADGLIPTLWSRSSKRHPQSTTLPIFRPASPIPLEPLTPCPSWPQSDCLPEASYLLPSSAPTFFHVPGTLCVLTGPKKHTYTCSHRLLPPHPSLPTRSGYGRHCHLLGLPHGGEGWAANQRVCQLSIL